MNRAIVEFERVDVTRASGSLKGCGCLVFVDAQASVSVASFNISKHGYMCGI